MALAPTRFNQVAGMDPLVNISGGVEPGNYAQQLNTLGSFINDIFRNETGGWSFNVTLPPNGTTVVPADFFQTYFNAYGAALNACITRRTLATTPWSVISTLSGANWTSFYNQLASLAVAVKNAITTAGL